MTRSEKIVDAARSLMSTPFHWHGRIPGVGVDCVGVVILSAKEAGIKIDDVPRYSKGDQSEVILREVKKVAKRVSSPRAGDVVILKYGKSRYHLGICAGKTFIHASGSPTVNGVVEEPIDSSLLVSVWRFR